MTSKLLGLIFTTICIIALLTFFTTTVNATNHQHHKHRQECKPPYTTLYVYTQPVQSICTLLLHNGKAVQAQDQNGSNTDYNKTG
jgi:hypothetical protein